MEYANTVRTPKRKRHDRHRAGDLHRLCGSRMTRTDRLLPLARERGDRLAVAVLEHDRRYVPEPADHYVFKAPVNRYRHATESKLRYAWGDR